MREKKLYEKVKRGTAKEIKKLINEKKSFTENCSPISFHPGYLPRTPSLTQGKQRLSHIGSFLFLFQNSSHVALNLISDRMSSSRVTASSSPAHIDSFDPHVEMHLRCIPVILISPQLTHLMTFYLDYSFSSITYFPFTRKSFNYTENRMMKDF